MNNLVNTKFKQPKSAKESVQSASKSYLVLAIVVGFFMSISTGTVMAAKESADVNAAKNILARA